MKRHPVQIFCDFDGTITTGDTVDLLLETLAAPEWREIEALWERGEIGSRECMAKQIPLIQGGWKAIEEVLATVKVDNSFSTFVRWCRRRGIPVSIVSDGLDRVINHLLKREGIKVDRIVSNKLVETANGGLALEFPHRGDRVVCASGQCKCMILDQAGSHTVKVVIGDGRSDFCWARNADLLFAKDKLEKYCRNQSIDHLPYDNFVQIRVLLEEMMGAAETVRSKPAAAFAEVPLLAQS